MPPPEVIVLLALLLSCAPDTPLPDAWMSAPPDLAPLPGVLHLQASDVVRGQPLRLAVSGASPRSTVHVIASQGGVAPGPCPAPLGGLCLDVPAPFVRLGSVDTDVRGDGTLRLPFPDSIPAGRTIGFQAIVPAGPDSVASAPIARQTCPLGQAHDGDACVPADTCRVDLGGCAPSEACIDAACVPLADALVEAHATITAGVATVDVGGSLPSVLVAHGEGAAPIVLDEGVDPIVVAGHHGAGRFLAFGHESYIGGSLTGPSDLDRLVENAARWAIPAGGTVGVAGLPDLEDLLRDAGFTVVSGAAPDDPTLDAWAGNSSTDLTDDEALALSDRVWRGGAVLLGGQAWWWSYSNPDVANAYPGNRVGNTVGVSWTAAYAHGWEDAVEPFPVDGCADAWVALQRLTDHARGDLLSDDDLDRCAGTVEDAVAWLSLDVPWFDGFGGLASALGGVAPSPADPLVPADEPLDMVVARYEARLDDDLPARRITAHPSAATYPGAVPADAPRVDRVVTVDGTHTGWNTWYWYSGAWSPRFESTGLYAAPGEVLTVTVPPEAVDAGLELQIGVHTDTLWHLERIERFPDIVNRTPLDAPTVEVASRFGGLVVVTVPRDTALGPVDIGIAGAVEAPRFVLGETDPADWPALRALPAPWAELASDSFVLTVPADVIRDLDDPVDLASLWEDLVDGAADLAGEPRDRPRAERIVVDHQISAGWLHSGYPIMGHDSEAASWVDAAGIRGGNAWGPLHELGHNHQWGPWVLPGTVESSVNLWSVYLMEEHLGIDRHDAHPALAPGEREARIDAYLATGPDFAAWSVWTALDTYLQLEEAFGWGFYEGVFTRYRALPAQPDGDDARIDEWVVQTSLEAGLDLTDFYAAWGLPFSPGAAARVAHLPPWVGHPME